MSLPGITLESIDMFVRLVWQFFYSNIENLVLWARSEVIGSAICPIYSWFQVSGVSKNKS
jgi:hypothetical protein